MIEIKSTVKIPLNLLSKEVLNTIKDDLSLDNPEVDKRKRLGLGLFGIPNKFKIYNIETDVIEIPIGYFETALAYLPDVKSECLSDLRACGTPIQIAFKGTLRPYQKEAVTMLQQNTVGIISSPTGSGKTIMMCSVISDCNTATLVLVNTQELANQFKKALLEFTDIKESEVNIIRAGKPFKPVQVNIGLFQSLRAGEKLTEINKHIGLVLTDEVHITGATTYYDTLNALEAKRKYGFSATPERDDGLTKLITYASGRVRKVITLADIVGNVMLPTIEVVKTEYYFPLFDMRDYTVMIGELAIDEERNQLIVDSIKKYKDKQIVLLCSRVRQCVALHKLIPKSKILVGNISEIDQKALKKGLTQTELDEVLSQRGIKHRRNVVEELNSGKLRVVISTYQLFSTGLDFKDLEVVAFCAPMKSTILVKQCRGRVMRVSKNKAPVCIDFQDHKVGLLLNQSRKRQRILRNYE